MIRYYSDKNKRFITKEDAENMMQWLGYSDLYGFVAMWLDDANFREILD